MIFVLIETFCFEPEIGLPVTNDTGRLKNVRRVHVFGKIRQEGLSDKKRVLQGRREGGG